MNHSQTLLKIIQTRRDVRGHNFLDKQISKENIELILKAAVSAPSVGYSQPWKFIIIEDVNIKNKIHKNLQKKMRKQKRYLIQINYMKT